MAVRGGTGLATSCETSAPNEAGQDPTKAPPPLPLSPPARPHHRRAQPRHGNRDAISKTPLLGFRRWHASRSTDPRHQRPAGPNLTQSRMPSQVPHFLQTPGPETKAGVPYDESFSIRSDHRYPDPDPDPSYLRDRGPPSSPPPLILVPQTAAQACGRDRSIRSRTRSGPRDHAQFWFSPVLLATVVSL